MITDSSDLTFPCTECQAGQMRQQRLTYFTWLGDELITVPNFPAWVCDVCGRREYDHQAVNRLSLLLNPNAGQPSSSARKPKQHPSHKGQSLPPQ
ncbi:MAG TPA: YgiT-type zinc finger protein [Anaerolineaceae bacterium]|nr:YgiT-type zinc finger protein [Anaerolineaceae bacterium]